MKLAKSLLLGSAAGLMAVAGANAADLPVRAAAPAVDYVRICNAYGNGFFYIPGTDTCLRVGGFIRADYILNDTRGFNAAADRAAQGYTFFARARINMDSRTGTEYGLLRTMTAIDFNAQNGQGTTAINLINAFVQFGGLTAGRVQSFFMYRWAQAGYGPFFQSTNLTYGTTNVLAYTATFGNGISATIALEDGNRRAPGIAGTVYAGRQMPDIVANINVSQGWGSARLAGAIHQIRPQAAGVDTKYGWAVLAGAEVNLPMLSPGALLWVQGTYADGASNFSGGRNDPTRLGYVNVNAYRIGGSLRTVKTWAVSAGFRHFWTPQLQSNIHAAYVDTSFSTLGRQTYGVANWSGWNIGKSLIWSPVAGLAIGVEGQYAQVRGRGINAPRVIRQGGVAKRTDDVWTARLRIQRDF